MNKRFRNFTLAALLLFSFKGAAQTSVQSATGAGKPIKVRYKSKNFKGTVKSILVRDKVSGKSALLAIPLVNAEEGLFEATFVLPFEYSKENTETDGQGPSLEVFPVKTTPETLAKSIDLTKQSNLVWMQTQKQEQQRLSYELSEAQKREKLETTARALSQAEQQKRKIKAQQVGEEALQLYDEAKYTEAIEKFNQAISLDPENNTYYFQYGVALFQAQDYQKSLVALSMADDGEFSAVEKNYFIGMNYFRLNETEKALKSFQDVREAEDKRLSPTATFYAAVLQYNTANYEAAKESLNFVLDTSADPKMDQAAEDLLEKIDAIQQFERGFEHKWLYNLSAGLMYDSNVLNASTANTPTDKAGLRGLISGSLERRLIFDYFKEWSILIAASDMYSTTTGLGSSDELQNTDPLMYSLTSPIKLKRTLFNKSYVLQATPGFESIRMNADGEGDRETTIDSLFLRLDNTFVHKADWIGIYNLEYRSDTSQIPAATEDDQSASKFILGTNQIFIQDPLTAKSYIAEASVALNDAKGINHKFQRISLGLTYTQAWFWKSQWAYRADYFTADYPDHTSGRKDSGFGASISASKALSPRVSTAVSLGYNNNSSNVDSYSYDKFTLSNIYTFSGAF